MTIHLAHPDGPLQQSGYAPVALTRGSRLPFWEGVSRAQESDGFGSPMPPLTVIGVQALRRPELLVEIEATAVLD